MFMETAPIGANPVWRQSGYEWTWYNRGAKGPDWHAALVEVHRNVYLFECPFCASLGADSVTVLWVPSG